MTPGVAVAVAGVLAAVAGKAARRYQMRHVSRARSVQAARRGSHALPGRGRARRGPQVPDDVGAFPVLLDRVPQARLVTGIPVPAPRTELDRRLSAARQGDPQ